MLSFSPSTKTKFKKCLDVLGLLPTATASLAKKAYHKKVLQYHPDKGGDADKFIEVQKAYSFFKYITSKKKKANHESTETIRALYTKNMTYSLQIELAEAYSGKKKKIILKRNRICPKCKGDQSEKCEECKGKKVTLQSNETEIIIKKGAYTGCKIVLERESEEYPGFIPGNVIFEIVVKDDKKYKRKGSDLFIEQNISLVNSLLGGEIKIDYFGGSILKCSSKDIIKPGMMKRIKGKGMPYFDNCNNYGDLNIKFNVIFPKVIDQKQAKLIRMAFLGDKENIEKRKTKPVKFNQTNAIKIKNLSSKFDNNNNKVINVTLSDYSEKDLNPNYCSNRADC